MKQPLQPLQAMLEKQFSELPRLIATKLVREKLESLGHSNNEALIGAIVDRLLAGEESGTIELDDGAVGHAVPETLTLSFNEEDASRIERAVAEFKATLPEAIRQSAKQAAKAMLRRYTHDWAQFRPYALAEMDQFRANLEARWSDGFDFLRMLIDLSRDIGVDFYRRASRSRSARRVHLTTALVHLHARAIQIGSEIMALMENGFADGAMARWRTLHEVTCVALVLNDGGDELAERYLAHEVVESKKALRQYQQCQPDLGYSPFPTREAKRIECDYQAAITRYGKEFAGDYGWVAGHLSIVRPNFSQIEDAAGRAMMRSHYKMASHNVHAGTKGIAHRLSAFGVRFAGIAGASNVGFVEPGQNLGLSLLHITMLLLPRRWTLDKIALLTALIDLADRIAPALARSEHSIARDERKFRKEAAARSARRRASRSS